MRAGFRFLHIVLHGRMASPNADSYVNAMSHRALTLQERAAHVKGAVPPDRLNSAMPKRWQSQKPFQDTSVLDERLNAAGLSRIVFEAAISLDFPEDTKVVSADTDIVSAMDIARAEHPDWQAVLASIKPY